MVIGTAGRPLVSISVMVVLFFVFGFLLLVFLFVWLGFVRRSGGVEIGLPIVLDSGWKFIHVREECGDLPHVLVGQGFVPGGHSGVANAGANRVIDVPLGIVGRIGDEVRRRRIEGSRERRGLAVEGSVAKSAIHGVELHAVFEIGIGRRERIADARGMTVHGV